MENTWRGECLRNGNARWGPFPCAPACISRVPPPRAGRAARRLPPRRSSIRCPAGTPEHAAALRTSRRSAAAARCPRDPANLPVCAAARKGTVPRRIRQTEAPAPVSCVRLRSRLRHRAVGRLNGAPAIALEAFLLAQLKARLRDAVELHNDFPGARIHLLVLYGGFIKDHVGARARVALDHMQRVAMSVPGRVPPGLLVKVRYVDDERIAVPMRHRIADLKVDGVQMGARSRGDNAVVMQEFVQKHDISRPLQNLERKGHIGEAWNAWDRTMPNGIHAVAFLLPL